MARGYTYLHRLPWQLQTSNIFVSATFIVMLQQSFNNFFSTIVKVLIFCEMRLEFSDFQKELLLLKTDQYDKNGENNMAKIAHLFFLLDFGGVERNIVNLSNRQAEAGNEVAVIISHKVGRMANALNPSVELIKLPSNGKMRELIALLGQYDIVHIHSTNVNPFFVWGSSLANVPVIINSIESSVQYPYSAYCDFLLTPSYFIKNLQSRIQKIQVIYNGIELDQTGPIESKSSYPDKIILAEVRRPNKEVFYGLDDLIGQLRLPNVKIEGWIIGQEGRSDENLKYYGVVDQPIDLLKEVDFLLHFPKHEALSNAIIEAMSVGALPIASAVGGISELIKHEETGFLAGLETLNNLADTVQFVDKILQSYIKHPSSFEDMRIKAFKTVKENFNLDLMHEQTISLCKKLLRNGLSRERSSLFNLVKEEPGSSHNLFFELLDTYCFHPQAGRDRIKQVDFDAFPEPQRAFLLGILAEEAIEKKQIPLAKQLLHYATQLWDNDYYLNLNLGMCLKMLNKPEEAEPHLLKSIELNPDEIEPYLLLLETFLSRALYDRVQEYATNLLERLPLQHPLRPTIALMQNQVVNFTTKAHATSLTSA